MGNVKEAEEMKKEEKSTPIEGSIDLGQIIEEKLNCSVCNKDVTNMTCMMVAKGMPDPKVNHSFGSFKKDKYIICYECMLKAYGVKS